MRVVGVTSWRYGGMDFWTSGLWRCVDMEAFIDVEAWRSGGAEVWMSEVVAARRRRNDVEVRSV